MDNNQQNKQNDQDVPNAQSTPNSSNDASASVSDNNSTIQPSDTSENISQNNSSDTPSQSTDLEQKLNTSPTVDTSTDPENQNTKQAAQSINPPMPTNGTPENPKKGNKTFYIVLATVLLLTLIAVFLIIMNRQSTTTETPINVVPTLEPIITEPAPSISTEESEVDAVDLENPAPTDLAPVETDLENL